MEALVAQRSDRRSSNSWGRTQPRNEWIRRDVMFRSTETDTNVCCYPSIPSLTSSHVIRRVPFVSRNGQSLYPSVVAGSVRLVASTIGSVMSSATLVTETSVLLSTSGFTLTWVTTLSVVSIFMERILSKDVVLFGVSIRLEIASLKRL